MATKEQTNLVRIDPGALDLIYWTVFFLPPAVYFAWQIMNSGLGKIWSLVSGDEAISTIVWLFLIFIAHELLHVVAYLGGGVPAKSLSMKIERKSLSFDMSVNHLVAVNLWRFSLLLPFFALTTVLALFSLADGPDSRGWLLLAMSTSGCAFDLAAFAALRGIEGNKLVEPGFCHINGEMHAGRSLQ